jgi:hypothetical protein
MLRDLPEVLSGGNASAGAGKPELNLRETPQHVVFTGAWQDGAVTTLHWNAQATSDRIVSELAVLSSDAEATR